MKTIAKLSVPEYEQIVATGVFNGKNHRRLELIRGELREMSTIAKLSLAEYERIVAGGVFDGMNRRRIELIRGELREMSPIGPPHADVVSWLTAWSVRNLPEDVASVRVQSPLAIDATDSEPEPDILWVRPKQYRAKHPRPPDVLLLIEVADSSLDDDRTDKAALFAEAGIAEYWIVNLIDRTVEVHRDPAGDRYSDVQSSAVGEFAQPLIAPEVHLDIAALFVART